MRNNALYPIDKSIKQSVQSIPKPVMGFNARVSLGETWCISLICRSAVTSRGGGGGGGCCTAAPFATEQLKTLSDFAWVF